MQQTKLLATEAIRTTLVKLAAHVLLFVDPGVRLVPQKSFGRQRPEKHEVSLLHNMKVDNGHPCEEFIEGSNLQNKILLA